MDKTFNVTTIDLDDLDMLETAVDKELFEATENEHGSPYPAYDLSLLLRTIQVLRAAAPECAPGVTLFIEVTTGRHIPEDGR